jgi:hypothetical protein
MKPPRVSQLIPALPLPLDHFAGQPRWSHERTATLTGRSRGILMLKWAENVRRRWGELVLANVRKRAGDIAALVPDAPDARDWLPAAAQIALTDAIIDLCLQGDARRLEALVLADALRDVTRLHRLLARAMGPHGGYRQVQAVYHKLYDIGRYRAEVGPCTAVVHCSGAALFGNPTWRLLQMVAHKGALQLLTGREDGEIMGLGDQPDSFWLRMRWSA